MGPSESTDPGVWNEKPIVLHEVVEILKTKQHSRVILLKWHTFNFKLGCALHFLFLELPLELINLVLWWHPLMHLQLGDQFHFSTVEGQGVLKELLARWMSWPHMDHHEELQLRKKHQPQ
jgi:hypothetical protein